MANDDRDGSFTAPPTHRAEVQAAVNRIANPMILRLGDEWARVMAAAELERRQP